MEINTFSDLSGQEEIKRVLLEDTLKKFHVLPLPLSVNTSVVAAAPSPLWVCHCASVSLTVSRGNSRKVTFPSWGLLI